MNPHRYRRQTGQLLGLLIVFAFGWTGRQTYEGSSKSVHGTPTPFVSCDNVAAHFDGAISTEASKMNRETYASPTRPATSVKGVAFSWDHAGKRGLVEKNLPWMSVQVRSLIASYLDKDSTTMLEYGGGGSTLFFSQLVKQLYTVESVGEFVQRIKSQSSDMGLRNIEVFHRAPNGYHLAKGEAVPDLSQHKMHSEMVQADVVNRESFEFWKLNGGPQGIKLPEPPAHLKPRYAKFKGNWEHNSAYIAAPKESGVALFDVVLIDGVARGACAFWILDYISEHSRVFIHDFYSGSSPEAWDHKFNLKGLLKYYWVVAKVEELSPYISGGTVVVLQKKAKAEQRKSCTFCTNNQKHRADHRGERYAPFF